MNKTNVFFIGLLVGVMFCCTLSFVHWFGGRTGPVSLEVSHAARRPMYTTITVSNPSDWPVQIERMDLHVAADDFKNYNPSESPKTPAGIREIVFERVINGHVEHIFYNDGPSVIVPPKGFVVLRLRIKNVDYPGLAAIGELRVSYHCKGKRDKIGIATIKNVSLDVESW